ncbi:MAG: hypothetical protein ACHQK9_09895 [Reyranellales bacterium]
MILGLSLGAFTLFHVIISLLGIASGLLVTIRMIGGYRLGGTNEIFLVTTIATSLTGFLFPFKTFGPAHIVGVISLVVLAVALVARYVRYLDGPWRMIYVISAVTALYLNVFVGVVQAFGKIGFLHKFAPTGSEPPFAVAQALVLLLFLALGFYAVKGFHPGRA